MLAVEATSDPLQSATCLVATCNQVHFLDSETTDTRYVPCGETLASGLVEALNM